MKIRGILIPLGDDHDEFRVIIHPHGGVNVERRGDRGICLTDVELLAVLHRAGVMVQDLVHKLGDVADALPAESVVCSGCHARRAEAGKVCFVCGQG